MELTKTLKLKIYDKINQQKNKFEFIYLIQSKEYINTCVYKFGKTTRKFLERFSEYADGSQIYFVYPCQNCDKLERIVKSGFIGNKHFKCVKGKEYYEGDLFEMIIIIKTIINTFDKEFSLENDDLRILELEDENLKLGYENVNLQNKIVKLESINSYLENKISDLKSENINLQIVELESGSLDTEYQISDEQSSSSDLDILYNKKFNIINNIITTYFSSKNDNFAKYIIKYKFGSKICKYEFKLAYKNIKINSYYVKIKDGMLIYNNDTCKKFPKWKSELKKYFNNFGINFSENIIHNMGHYRKIVYILMKSNPIFNYLNLRLDEIYKFCKSKNDKILTTFLKYLGIKFELTKEILDQLQDVNCKYISINKIIKDKEVSSCIYIFRVLFDLS